MTAEHEFDIIRDSLDHCVKCTICESACPVAAVTPLFPGPKYVGPQAERFRGAGPSVDASLDYCSSCGICTLACPQGVHVAEINSRARAVMKAQKGMPLRDQHTLPARAPGQARHPGRPAGQLRAVQPVRAAAGREDRRHPPQRRDAQVRRPYLPALGAPPRRGRRPATKQVVYFHGCSTNYFEPGLGRMTVAVLEHNGFRVVVPPQGCCGLPLQSNGIFDAGRGYVRRLVAHLVPYASAGRRDRRHVHQLRPDAQARGHRDPRGAGRGPADGEHPDLRHLRVPGRPARRPGS